MDALSGMRCEACERGAPLLTDEEIQGLLPQIPAWEVEVEDDIPRLIRTFEFEDFASALAFTVRVGEIAEEEQHHPAILTEWGRVTILWWTHKIGGLHRNDFVMAAKTDQLLEPWR